MPSARSLGEDNDITSSYYMENCDKDQLRDSDDDQDEFEDYYEDLTCFCE